MDTFRGFDDKTAIRTRSVFVDVQKRRKRGQEVPGIFSKYLPQRTLVAQHLERWQEISKLFTPPPSFTLAAGKN